MHYKDGPVWQPLRILLPMNTEDVEFAMCFLFSLVFFQFCSICNDNNDIATINVII